MKAYCSLHFAHLKVALHYRLLKPKAILKLHAPYVVPHITLNPHPNWVWGGNVAEEFDLLHPVR